MNGQNLVVKLSAWVLSEIVLNWVGFDDMADYSEFLQKAQDLADSQHPQIVMVAKL